MRFTYVVSLAAKLSVKSLFVISKEIIGDINEKQIGQDDGLPDSDQMKQLQSMQEMISKLSTQMQKLQRDSEQKERQVSQMTSQLNDVADENQNLRQLLVKIMSETNLSNGVSDVLDKDSPIVDYRREFNQYMEETGGVTYVRWGRKICEDPAYPLYTGYAASGSAYPPNRTPGGTTDIICLHPQPQYAGIRTGYDFSSLYAVEYDFVNLPFSTVNNGGANLLHNDIPCTVCHISSRSHQFMLPGRNTCPSGWVLEYWGYLASSNTNQQKNSMICLDEAPETLTGGAAESFGGQMGPVADTCTASYCPPYRPDYELTCAVCSK